MKKHLFTLSIALLVMTGFVNAQCPANFSWAQNQPNVIDFTNLSGPQNPAWTAYIWDFGDSQIAGSFNAQHVYSTPGTYNVCLTLLDSMSQYTCVYCDTVNVTGSILCNMYLSSQVLQNATCSTCADGMAQVYAVNGTAPFTYQWSDGQTSPIASGLLPGLYTCCVTDANGCVACDSMYVNYANSTSCGISFVANAQSQGWFMFNATVTGTNSNPSVVWDYGDLTYGYGQNTWHQYAQSGTYAVCATVTDSTSQCTATWCDTVVVSVTPQSCSANFAIFMDSVNTNQAWIYNLSSGGPGMTYQWFWGDNSPIDTGAYPAHVYQNTGSYNVCLVVVDQANQCTDTMCQLLWVPRLTQQASLAPFYVNVLPANAMSTPDHEAAAAWVLYPNPTNDVLNVSGGTANDQFIITDLAGRTVMSGSLQNNAVNVSELSGGVFFFTLVKENGQTQSKRFVRE